MNRPRGVALVIALFAVALAMLLVLAMLSRGELAQARQRDAWRGEQAWQLQLGAEAWAQRALANDGGASGITSLDQDWARPMPALVVAGARIEGRVFDLGACFNLNRLAPRGRVEAQEVQRFERLLRALQLPAVIASQAAAAQPGGLWADASALRRLPALPRDAWPRLSPLVCALPLDQTLNLNTAPPALWRLLDAGIGPEQAARLARDRGGAAYASLAAVEAALQGEGIRTADLAGCAVASDYFLVEGRALADGIPLHFRSVLQRDAQQVRVIARARGGHG